MTAATAAWVTGAQALDRLEAAGLPVARTARAATPEEAAEVAASSGGLVVLKLDHPAALHKTEIGGVRVGLRADEVAAAASEMRDRLEVAGTAFSPVGSFLVQEMLSAGAEVLIGFSMDPTFGPIVSVGLGGVLVEHLRQVACRALPLTSADVRDALEETVLGPILRDFRGHALDVDGLIGFVVDFAAQSEASGLVEADINPVIVLEQRCVAVDARLRYS